MNISVVIITKNEAYNIGRCIESCKPLNAEIIVLDSHSTDNTREISASLGATVYKVDWQGYGATKNLGAEKAKHDWILSIDADEALDRTLCEHIFNNKVNNSETTGYWLSRIMVFQGEKIRNGAFKNERHLRLYNKNKLRWNLNNVHEKLEPIDNNASITSGELQGNILHYSYADIKDLKNRQEKYARLGATDLAIKSNFYLFSKKILSPVFTFFKNYFFRLGLLDGKTGFILAREQAIYIFKKYNYALRLKSE